MDTSPIPGFITRKQAAERCQRAERTLQRYWSKAIEMEDFNILRHLKLHTEDEQVIEGPDVTKARIEQLKKEGRNPTWFVEADWVAEKYGPRTDEAKKESSKKVSPTATGEQDAKHPTSEVVEVLKDRLHDKDSEIQYLRERLKEKSDLEKERNDLETERNLREKETNELMRNLGILVGGLKQQGLLGGEVENTDKASGPMTNSEQEKEEQPVVQDVEVVKPIHTTKQRKQGTARKRKSSVQNKTKSTPSTKRKSPIKKQPAKKKKTEKHKWYETPTLNRFFSGK